MPSVCGLFFCHSSFSNVFHTNFCLQNTNFHGFYFYRDTPILTSACGAFNFVGDILETYYLLIIT